MLVIAVLPFVPGAGIGSKLLLGLLIVVFGFFFVTVASRIVGIIGSSSNPISGMTIATLMATCLVFVGLGWTGDVYQPMALCVGGDGLHRRRQRGRDVAGPEDRLPRRRDAARAADRPAHRRGRRRRSSSALTMQLLDQPAEAAERRTLIGTDKFPAPQATLMATLIKGLLALNLDWQFVMVGVCLAVTVELCGVESLSFAVGAYLPLSTTAPIFVGGVVRAFAERAQPQGGRPAVARGRRARPRQPVRDRPGRRRAVGCSSHC